jgi:arginase
MKNQYILTPFFLDEPLPGLGALAGDDWLTIEAGLPAEDKQDRMSVLHKALANVVKETLLKGARPVSIAGDCVTTIGVLAGLQRAGINPTLIWFDAHGDFNTWETTPSGFLGGMPLAMLVGMGEQRMPQAVGLRNIPQDDVILTDARDLDPGEKLLVEGSNVHHLPLVDDLLDYSLPDDPLWVHFDTDVIDPQYAPAQNYPAPGGPDPALMKRVFKRLQETGRVVAISLSSWNPELDEDGGTREVCMDVLGRLVEG